MEGWIKIHRKIIENPIIRKPKYFLIWSILLLLASHKENHFIFNGEKRVCLAGQFVTGRKRLSEISGVREGTVEDILSYLETQQQIQQQKTNKFRLITIVNWEEYQETQQENQQQSNNKVTTKLQQSNTIKNEENDKNDNNEKKVIAIVAAIEFWEKNIGLLTQHICNELQYLEETHGEDNLLKAIKVSIEAGVRNIRYVKGVLEKEKNSNYAWSRQIKSNTISI